MTVEGRSKLREEQQSLMNYTSFEQESSESNHLNSEKGGCLARIYPAGFFPILKDVLKISLPLVSLFDFIIIFLTVFTWTQCRVTFIFIELYECSTGSIKIMNPFLKSDP